MSVIVRAGNIRLRVVRNPKWLGHQRRRVVDWEFRWRDGAGRRRRLKRARRKDAIAEARRIARDLAAGRSAELSTADVASFRAGIVNLYGCATTIEIATAEYAEARRRLAGAGSVLEAADFYARHHPRSRSDKSVSDVVDELLAARRADGASARHLADLESRLGRLKKDFNCPITDLTAPAMSHWLRNLRNVKTHTTIVRARTRANYRGALSNLLNFSIQQKYLDADRGDLMSAPIERDREVQIFTIDEMRLILRHARESVLPVLVLGAFAGLRTSETQKMTWDRIHWDRALIAVPKNTKTGKRLAPLFDNCRAWLEPLAGSGPIVRIATSTIAEGMVDAVARANAELVAQHSTQRICWKRNGLRHSFVSYWASFEHDLWKISERTGHSVKILKSDYQRPDVFPEDGHAWFAIQPARGPVQLSLFSSQDDRDRNICPLFTPSDHARAENASKDWRP